MIFFLLALSFARAPIQAPAPIPGGHARVLAQFFDESGFSIPNVRVLCCFYPGDELVGESDAAGHFVADIPCQRDNGTAWFRARVLGRAVGEFDFELRQGRAQDFGRIVLEPGGVVVGRVVDGEGRPLAGAQAVVFERADPGPPGSIECERPGGPRLASALSGADGSYRIEGVPVGRCHVWIQHETAWACWLPQPVEVRAGEDISLPEVALVARPPEYRIEGVVLDARGQPIQGAEVHTAGFFPRRVSRDTGSVMEVEAVTDSAGRFVLHLPQVFEAGHDLSIEAPGDLYDEASLSAVAAGTRGVVVQLSALRSFDLAVANTEGLPIERFGWSLVINSTLHTGSNAEPHVGGRATIHLPDLPFELMVEAPGYRAKKVGRFPSGELPEVVEVLLERGPIVSGVVTFEGRLVAGAVVECVNGDFNLLSDLIRGHTTGLFHAIRDSVVTDEFGRFEVPRLGTPRVRARAEGFAAVLSDPVLEKASMGLILELAQGGSVLGSVRLPGGRPHAPLDVELYRERSFGFLGPDDAPVIRTQVDDDGAFRADHLESGAWLVALIPSGTLLSDLSWSDDQTKELSKVPWVAEVKDRKATRLDIDLVEPGTCRLAGRVSWGDHLREGYVQLLLEGPMALEIANVPLEEGGRFEIAARSPGTYRLVVRGGPHHDRTVTDLVQLSSGENTWSRDLPAESWKQGDVRLDR